MPISDLHSAIFIHIPKNAGESIERSMGMYGEQHSNNYWGVVDDSIVLQHLTASDLRAEINVPRVWNQYKKFAVVRNPFSKAVSEYYWFLRYGPKCTFSEWVLSLEDRLKINRLIHVYEIGHNIPQYQFLYDTSGTLLVDTVLRFETISEDFEALSRCMGWGVELKYAPTTASGSKIPFQSFYDQGSVDIISKVYQKDIELFGYSVVETFSNFVPSEGPKPFIADFDPASYLQKYNDVKEANIDALTHYLAHGFFEGRERY